MKFNDADLIGWPFQVVVGKKGLAEGVVELKVTGQPGSAALSRSLKRSRMSRGSFRRRGRASRTS